MSKLVAYDRGGIHTNLDSTLTAQDLARGIKLEEHTSVVDRYLSETDGTYGWQGMLSRNGNLTVPKSVLKESSFQGDRISRVRARLNSGDPPLLVSYDSATDTPLFAEEDKEAYEDGYICGSCFQYQAVPNAPECNWRVDADALDKGCGHRNH